MKKSDKNSESQIAGMISINIGKSAEKPYELSNFDADSTLVLPTRNLVLFPGVALPIQIGREGSLYVSEFGKKADVPIAVICQRDPDVDNPSISDLYEFGTLARVIDVISLPNGIKTAIVEGLIKIRTLGASTSSPIQGALAARVKKCKEKVSVNSRENFELMMDRVRELYDKLLKAMSDEGGSQMQMPQIEGRESPEMFLASLAVHLPFDPEEKQELLKANTLEERASLIITRLALRLEQMKVMKEIMEKTRSRMEEGQRNAFLQQQMEVIRQEMDGDDADELDELEERAARTDLPEDVANRFTKEMRKIRRYNPSSPDYAVQYTYLDTLLSLPWNVFSEYPVDMIYQARGVMDADHFGLKKVKERIIEQLVQIQHSDEGHAPIICFVGPPGVGKTSLGKSIAKTLDREFQRISLGGLHDEAEIRGHRRTYIGAMPGRIIEAMRRCSTTDPVIMLDELDKIGADYKGDPAAALLEVLDPAQNHKFHDNYIDVDYDLSKVIFIATANSLQTISKPLLDRIEVIELTGYTTEEKIEIAVRHIIPRLRRENNIGKEVFRISRSVVRQLIDQYTAESGVRQLGKLIESLMRKKLLQGSEIKEKAYFAKYIKKITSGDEPITEKEFSPVVKASDLSIMLGPAPYLRERYEGNDIPGVVTGLAWTSVGGETLLVEAATSAGKGNLSLTGNLGDVMKESATLASEWIKVNAENLGIDPEILKTRDIHIHFPEGAVPKDGPSAGITIVTALVSTLTGRLVAPRIAMTGEITLRGRVLPVGGIKEKLLAARRAGLRTIILSENNRPNVEDIEAEYLEGLNFIYVRTIRQVLDAALLPL